MDYDDLIDDLDCAVFSGEILETHMVELEDHIRRWMREISRHKANRNVDEQESNK